MEYRYETNQIFDYIEIIRKVTPLEGQNAEDCLDNGDCADGNTRK